MCAARKLPLLPGGGYRVYGGGVVNYINLKKQQL